MIAREGVRELEAARPEMVELAVGRLLDVACDLEGREQSEGVVLVEPEAARDVGDADRDRPVEDLQHAKRVHHRLDGVIALGLAGAPGHRSHPLFRGSCFAALSPNAARPTPEARNVPARLRSRSDAKGVALRVPRSAKDRAGVGRIRAAWFVGRSVLTQAQETCQSVLARVLRSDAPRTRSGVRLDGRNPRERKVFSGWTPRRRAVKKNPRGDRARSCHRIHRSTREPRGRLRESPSTCERSRAARRLIRRRAPRALGGAGGHLRREQLDDEGAHPQQDREVGEIEIGKQARGRRTEMEEVDGRTAR